MVTSIIFVILELFNWIYFHNKWLDIELICVIISYLIIYFTVATKLVTIDIIGFVIVVIFLGIIYSVPHIVLSKDKIYNAENVKTGKVSKINLFFYKKIIEILSDKMKESINDHKDSKKLLSNIGIGLILFIGIMFSLITSMSGNQLDLNQMILQFQSSTNLFIKSASLEYQYIFPLVYAVYATHLIINNNLKNLIKINSD